MDVEELETAAVVGLVEGVAEVKVREAVAKVLEVSESVKAAVVREAEITVGMMAAEVVMEVAVTAAAAAATATADSSLPSPAATSQSSSRGRSAPELTNGRPAAPSAMTPPPPRMPRSPAASRRGAAQGWHRSRSAR